MVDKFLFSNGQDLTGLTGTGVVSEHIWDLEQDDSANVIETDGQMVGWLNVTFGASNAGANEGMWIELNSSSDVGGTTDLINLVIMRLTDAELTAAVGKTFSVGFSKSLVERYISVWYDPISTAMAGTATPVYASYNIAPLPTRVIQKQPS